MASVPSPFVWEMTKGLPWETLAPGSTQLTLSPQTPVPVPGVLWQHVLGAEGVSRAHRVPHGRQGTAASRLRPFCFLLCICSA